MNEPSKGRAVDPMLGFRRIDRVRIIVDRDAVRAEVLGIVHRLPRTVPVSLRVAHQLVAGGAPVVVLHTDHDSGDLSDDVSSRHAHPAGADRPNRWPHLHRVVPEPAGAA